MNPKTKIIGLRIINGKEPITGVFSLSKKSFVFKMILTTILSFVVAGGIYLFKIEGVGQYLISILDIK